MPTSPAAKGGKERNKEKERARTEVGTTRTRATTTGRRLRRSPMEPSKTRARSCAGGSRGAASKTPGLRLADRHLVVVPDAKGDRVCSGLADFQRPGHQGGATEFETAGECFQLRCAAQSRATSPGSTSLTGGFHSTGWAFSRTSAGSNPCGGLC